MSYRFKLDEPFEIGVRRIALQQIDRAIVRLQPGEGRKPSMSAPATEQGPEASVHDVRKRLKRLRALLRLARPALGEHLYGQENHRYRDTARLLAGVRDREVMIQTAVSLEATAAGRTRTALRAVSRALLRGASPTVDADTITHAVDNLKQGRSVMADIQCDGHGFAPAFAGAERTYRQAARAFTRAYETHADEDFHASRKLIQHHWRHMSLLAGAWPALMKVRIAGTGELSDTLGQDHDLAVLCEAIGNGAIDVSAPHRALVEECARMRQRELRRSAHLVGQRLFAETSAAFSARIASYWGLATADSAAGTTDG